MLYGFVLPSLWYKKASSWWRCIDQKIFLSIIALFFFSLVLVASAGPTASYKIGASGNHFIYRQIFYILLGLAIIISISAMKQVWVLRLGIIGFCVSIILLIIVQFCGISVKGATRWVNIFGISIQPSEIIKPFFFVLTGFILSGKAGVAGFTNRLVIVVLTYLVVAAFIIIQPDFGMLIMLSAGFGMQLFIFGIPWLWVICIAMFLSITGVGAYLFFPHVALRINNFINADLEKNYQVKKALLAFKKGSMYGRGIGEGKIKNILPDAHTDFIFSVAAEELGIISNICITLIFAFIVIRVLLKIAKSTDEFVRITIFALIIEFGLSAVANIAVNLHLIPTKGLTLPMISYGGSSMVSSCILLGIVLCLCRKGTNKVYYRINEIIV